ncbi:MAG: DNA translocase FtsK 4TM domain-containing protein [Gammaproteobacteria bacterium]|nr:DNA translocase FtsK 4TM domain-containing protein [Gammaproteobacteria bacterium]
MAQATRKRQNADPLAPQLTRALREGAFFVLLAISAYLLISLVTFNVADPGWSHAGEGRVSNAGGSAGAWFADVFLNLFGYVAYSVPLMVACLAWLVFRGVAAGATTGLNLHAMRWGGFLIVLISACGLGSLHFTMASGTLPPGIDAGGALGHSVGELLVGLFDVIGATLFLLALFLAAVTLFTGYSWFAIMDTLGGWTLALVSMVQRQLQAANERLLAKRAREQRETVVKIQRRSPKRKAPRIEPVIRMIEPSERVAKERQIRLFENPPDTELPPLSLLDEPSSDTGGYSSEALNAMSRLVELKLADFGVQVEVVAVHPGPVITRFELQLAAGVKVNQISNLAKDIARSLSIISVRVVEIIPGKSTVGLEIPNEQRELVRLSEILRSKAYDKTYSPLTLALGKDIGGNPVVADLARMPHLLVAGTTGAGKSVALNAMLLSMIYKATPRDVRLIMIDPKMLELNVYAGIPHLLAPVVTDMKEAGNALRWCVGEMENRYRLMAALGVRNVAGYNRKVRDAIDSGKPLADPLYNAQTAFDPEAPPPTLDTLPYIVVVVDELADMMMVVGKKVEELIARVAQKARAAGIHLILATQRPSVDVITGLIKANIPCRIAFQVSSKVDSRTILDQMGAEQLLGHGDMLYLPPGSGHPTRVHGAFVDDHEVHAVVKNLRSAGEPDYLEEVLSETNGSAMVPGNGNDSAESDPLYDDAVAIVTETRKASISYVQRRLKVGYNRAARMLEDMESAGVVSALQPNGSREVLAPPPVQ